MADPQQAGIVGDPQDPNQTSQVVNNDFFGWSEEALDQENISPVTQEEPLPEIAPIEDPSRNIPQEEQLPEISQDIQQGAPSQQVQEAVQPIQENQTGEPEEIFSQTDTPQIDPIQDLHLDSLQDTEEVDAKPSFAVHIDEPEEESKMVQDSTKSDKVEEEETEESKMVQDGTTSNKVEEEEEEEIMDDILPIQEEDAVQDTAEDKQNDENPLVQKFRELYTITQTLYDLKQTTTGFDVLGADNDKLRIMYNFFVGDETYPLLLITKTETDKETDEEDQHELSFYLDEEKTSLSVNVDDTILFSQEDMDDSDTKTKMQITDKINKFQFLLNEELRKIEREQQEKNAQEQERKKLQDVFRNF